MRYHSHKNEPTSKFQKQMKISTERQDTNCFSNALIDVHTYEKLKSPIQGRESDFSKTYFKAIMSRDEASSDEVCQHATRSDIMNNVSHVTIPGSNTIAQLHSPVDTTCSSISSKETVNFYRHHSKLQVDQLCITTIVAKSQKMLFL